MSPAKLLITLVATVVLGASLAGCADDGEPAAGEPDPISFERTGGLAGTRILLEIDPDGGAVLIEGDPDDERTSELTIAEEEFADLQAALRDAQLDQLEAKANVGCEDCFQYRLRFGPESIEADGPSLPTAARPAVKQLNAIVNRES